MLQYVIEAYSPTAHQSLRQVVLSDLAITQQFNQIEANQQATAFAHTLNTQAKLGATDWVGSATLQDLGVWPKGF